jgi:hypothetical protein
VRIHRLIECWRASAGVDEKQSCRPQGANKEEHSLKNSGAKPGPDDSVFLDPDYDTLVALSEEKLRAHALEAMRAAKIPSHLVYAYAKTGFIVNEQGYEQMSSADRAEYNAAIEEYFVIEESQERGDRN